MLDLRFDNRALRELPLDPNEENRSRQVFGACLTRVRPTPVKAPRTLAVAREVAELLDLSAEFVESPDFAEVFAGNRLLPGMDPVSACYGGHQFGSWAGQLGDGRAITLGELENSRGEHWELQLKGAGPTPYSRRADGRAVLRSSIREFLYSEAMFHLGIPTTRALALVATGEEVMRDLLYDGNARAEPAAIVCRVAPSFLRFGNFEIFAARDDLETLKSLGAHTLKAHFAELGAPSPEAYQELLSEVGRRTATLMAAWMAKGFVHGVMNTDNMSILGLTIDYGPFGFLDHFERGFTPNITDASGRRYRYENQPGIALWNLVQLARALFPLIGDVERVERALEVYGDTLSAARAHARRKTRLARAQGGRDAHGRLSLRPRRNARRRPVRAASRHRNRLHALLSLSRGRENRGERRAERRRALLDAEERLLRLRRPRRRRACPFAHVAPSLRAAGTRGRTLRCGAPERDERRESEVRAQKLLGATRHRPSGSRRCVARLRAPRRFTPPLRRTTRARTLCRKASRLGAPSPGLFDAVVQFLSSQHLQELDQIRFLLRRQRLGEETPVLGR
jgi:uncharacterized protein YdiU (UPF0061 family)